MERAVYPIGGRVQSTKRSRRLIKHPESLRLRLGAPIVLRQAGTRSKRCRENRPLTERLDSKSESDRGTVCAHQCRNPVALGAQRSASPSRAASPALQLACSSVWRVVLCSRREESCDWVSRLLMREICWERYPHVAQFPMTKSWLQIQGNLGLAANTIEAYGRALEDYLTFCCQQQIEVATATREHLSLYVHDLASRPNPRGANICVLDSGVGLANATLQQRLTAIRLFYDYLMEEDIRSTNPVGRGCYTPGKGFSGAREKGLIPCYCKLPWIPFRCCRFVRGRSSSGEASIY